MKKTRKRKLRKGIKKILTIIALSIIQYGLSNIKFDIISTQFGKHLSNSNLNVVDMFIILIWIVLFNHYKLISIF